MTSATRLALGIESGGTGTRWCLADAEGRTFGEGGVAALHGHVFSEPARQRAAVVIDDLRSAVSKFGPPCLILAGITGLGPTSGPADFLRQTLASRFQIATSDVQLFDDMWLVYRALFAPGEGIVVSGGTGSFAYHLASDGAVIRAGGYGILVDDAGGGAWIGKRALRAILRLEDQIPGQGWSTVLGRHIAVAIGGNSWDAARSFVYGGDRGSLALLASEVAKAAAEGDVVAGDLFSEAGAELASLAIALRRRLGMKPVALTGRAAYLSPRVAEAFSLKVEGPVHFHPAPESAAAAARLAFSLS